MLLIVQQPLFITVGVILFNRSAAIPFFQVRSADFVVFVQYSFVSHFG